MDYTIANSEMVNEKEAQLYRCKKVITVRCKKLLTNSCKKLLTLWL